MSHQTIVLDITQGLATLTLSQAGTGNALNIAMCADFERHALSIAADRSVRAVLLTGSGRNFCVGGDISGMTDPSVDRADILQSMIVPLHRGLLALSKLDAPLVVAVRGAAAGAGLSLVAAADLVVASRTAKFVMAYAAIGLSPDGGATWSLPRIIGQRRTLELALTNRRLDASEALDWGLITTLVDDADLDPVAREVSQKLANGPTIAFGAVRKLLRTSSTNDLGKQLNAELAAMRLTGASSDAGIGIAAFQTKQEAAFTGTPYLGGSEG